MKQLINKSDIKNLIGRWIVQLDDSKENFKLTESKNDDFWLEKRISFVNCVYGVDASPHYTPKEKIIILSGIYYCKGFFTEEEFVPWFNNALPTYNKEGHGRFHRLLTNDELDWLNEHLKK